MSAHTADLLYSDTEEALRAGVRQLFAERCPPESVTRLYDPHPQDFSGVWHTLATELGVAGLLVPESLGGADASAREAAVVMEEIGRAVAPVPFLSSAVLATIALLRAGDTATLPALAQGDLTAALVVPLSSAPGDPVTAVSAGAALLAECIASVGHRYPDADPFHGLPGPIPAPDPERYEWTDFGAVLGAIEACKAIDCYEYQSCEHPAGAIRAPRHSASDSARR